MEKKKWPELPKQKTNKPNPQYWDKWHPDHAAVGTQDKELKIGTSGHPKTEPEGGEVNCPRSPNKPESGIEPRSPVL